MIINKLNEAVYGYIAQNDPPIIVHSYNNHHDEAKPVGSTDGLLYSYFIAVMQEKYDREKKR